MKKIMLCLLAVLSFHAVAEEIKSHVCVDSPPTWATNISQITDGWNYTCGLADQGVVCWSSYKSSELFNGKIVVPSSSEPTKILGSGNRHCATVKDGVHCFGMLEIGYGDRPFIFVERMESPNHLLKDITEIFSARNAAFCALTKRSEVVCWGNMIGRGGVIQGLKNPTKLYQSPYHSLGRLFAADTDDGIVFWDIVNNNLGGIYVEDELFYHIEKSPIDLSGAEKILLHQHNSGICGYFSNEGVKCSPPENRWYPNSTDWAQRYPGLFVVKETCQPASRACSNGRISVPSDSCQFGL